MTYLMAQKRSFMPAEDLQSGIDEVAIRQALSGLFPEDKVNSFISPDDEMAEFMWGFSQTAQGNEMFQRMFDMALRSKPRVVGKSIEETALLAAKREGIELFAEALLAALAKGEQLVNKRKNAR